MLSAFVMRKLRGCGSHFLHPSSQLGQRHVSDISFSTDLIGHLADSSIVCYQGASMAHAVISSKFNPSPSDSSLSLNVEYRTRYYSFGSIPSTLNRRERHGSDEEVLISRFVDRAIRPLFVDIPRRDIQLTVTAHASDGVHDPAVMAVNAASMALSRCNFNWEGPLGCVKIGRIDGQFVVNPSVEELQKSDLDLLYASTASRPVMIEMWANELPEDIVKQAMQLAHSETQLLIEKQRPHIPPPAIVIEEPVISIPEVPDDRNVQKPVWYIDVSNNIVRLTCKTKSTATEEASPSLPPHDIVAFDISNELLKSARSIGYQEARALFCTPEAARKVRGRNEGTLRTKIEKTLTELYPSDVYDMATQNAIRLAADTVMTEAFRDSVLATKNRVDGRGLDDIRDIRCQPDVIPTVHGSAIFSRGETQVLCSTTLGPKEDAKEVTSYINGEIQRQTFFIHYDFPPYCTGEIGNSTATNRRMIGHGNLAEKALMPVIPSFDDFPYTIRLYSECTSSNGSSSMATVCGATLALMDAGVPLKAPVAGVSIGLVTDSSLSDKDFNAATDADKYVLMTDILGTEDHYGDMDFKIAGTATGITAIQLDVKLAHGVPMELLAMALDKARTGRMHILQKMHETLPVTRDSLKPTAPRSEIVRYDPERKRFLIGPGGEMIKFIEDTYACSLDTTEDGVTYIYGPKPSLVERARDLVQDLVILVKEGDVLSAEVLEVKDFGAIVKITRAQEAILHVSELSHDPLIMKRSLSEVLAVGQRLKVKVISVDKSTGLVKVSRKQLLDKQMAVPDPIKAMSPEDISKNGQSGAIDNVVLPTFPVVPPRNWSPEYFRVNVATDDDIKTAMSSSRQNVVPMVAAVGAVGALKGPPTQVLNTVPSKESSSSNARPGVVGAVDNSPTKVLKAPFKVPSSSNVVQGIGAVQSPPTLNPIPVKESLSSTAAEVGTIDRLNLTVPKKTIKTVPAKKLPSNTVAGYSTDDRPAAKKAIKPVPAKKSSADAAVASGSVIRPNRTVPKKTLDTVPVEESSSDDFAIWTEVLLNTHGKVEE